MGVGIAGFSLRFLIVLGVLVLGSSEAKRRTAETSFSHGFAMEIDEDTAERMWIHCRRELMKMNYAITEFDLCYTDEGRSICREMNPEAALLAKEEVHRAVNSMTPQMKESLLDCLRTKNLVFSVSAEEVTPKSWFIKFLGVLFGWSNKSRRHLAHVPQLTLESPDSTSFLENSPSKQSSLPHDTPAKRSSPSGNTPAKLSSPSGNTLAKRSSPSDNTPAKQSSPLHRNSPKHSPSSEKSPPKYSSLKPRAGRSKTEPSPKHKEDSSKKDAAFAAVAVAVLSLITLMLLCCLKCKGNRVGRDGLRDEKPLLYLNNFSAGSSQNSVSVDSSGKEYSVNSNLTGGRPSFATKLSMVSEGRNSVSEAPGGPPTTLPILKPPPGRLAPPHALAATAASAPPAPPAAPAPPSAPAPPLAPAPPPPKAAPPPPPRPLAKPGAQPPPLPPQANGPPPLPPKSLAGNSKMPPAAPFAKNAGGPPKTKLKPFFWDKCLPNPGQSMVWNEISGGSFQFNEEMIESLFGYANAEKNKNTAKKGSESSEPQYIQLINPKKAQNLSILLKALNVTTAEVYDALKEGNELPAELLRTIIKMAPTPDEELKLRLFSGDVSQLGPAERFLKVLVEVPFAFKRMEALLFMSSLQEEVFGMKESFATLEVACKELKGSRLFLKLLEAVLKTGNRMNDGTFRGGAQAFKLDTLLKLSDVKGIDGKTTLLHFVVLEIIRSEGRRAARLARESNNLKSDDLAEIPVDEKEHFRAIGLEVVSGLSHELENVKKAAIIDAENLTSTVSNLGHQLLSTRDFLRNDMSSINEDSDFHRSLAGFVEHAEAEITGLLEEENRIMALVRSTVDYFQGQSGKEEGLRLFTVVRDFLKILDKACNEVRKSSAAKQQAKNLKPPAPKIQGPTQSSPPEVHQSSSVQQSSSEASQTSSEGHQSSTEVNQPSSEVSQTSSEGHQSSPEAAQPSSEVHQPSSEIDRPSKGFHHHHHHQSSFDDMRQKLFPLIAEQRKNRSSGSGSSSSSDDDSQFS